VALLLHSLLCVTLPAARNHVNRMCLAADVPLVESGTAGYLGQVTVVKKVSLLLRMLSKIRICELLF